VLSFRQEYLFFLNSIWRLRAEGCLTLSF